MNAPDRLPATPPAAAGAEPHVMKTYGRLPIALSHGRGCWVWDTEGKKYLDGLGAASPSTRSATPTRSWCRRCRTRSAS